MAFSIFRNVFNAGYLSPLMDARVELQKYQEGARLLDNFLLTAYGGVRKRGGMEFINACAFDATKSRVKAFEVSRDRSYMIEFAEGVIRFFRNGARVLNAGVPVQVNSPYLEEELNDLQFSQINDVLFIVHRNHFPRRLSRLSDTNWTLTEEAFDDPPFMDQNLNEALTLTSDSNTGAIAGITASSGLFKPGHVGSVWGIEWERDPADFERTIGIGNASVTSQPILIQGTWAIITTGNWTGTLRLQRRPAFSPVGTPYEEYRSYSAANDRNIAPSETVDELMEYRLAYNGTSGANSPTATLEARTLFVKGVFKITGYTSPTAVTVSILKPLYKTTATYRWSEAAWSEANGYPGAIAFFESRVFYAGTYREPQTGWASAGDNYVRFIKGTLDTDSFKFVLNATELNAILSMVADRQLLVLTSGGEWVLASRTNNGALTPSSNFTRIQSAVGSDPVQARLVNSMVIFVDYGGGKLYEYGYSFQDDKYKETDLTLVAGQVTGQGIISMAYMRRPDPIIWCVTRDGQLLGFTYMKSQGVAGWHPHSVGGFVESADVIRGEGAVDELWITVRRQVNGQTKRYIERMFPAEADVQRNEQTKDYFYVDSGRSFVESGIDEVRVTGGVPAAYKLTMKPGPITGAWVVDLFRSWTTATPPASGFRSSLVVKDENEMGSFTFTWTVWNNNVPVAIWVANGSTRSVNDAGPWIQFLGESSGAPIFEHEFGFITEITGMGHLEGATVAVLGDGFDLGDRVVTAGGFELPGRYQKVTVGLRMRSILQPMTLEATNGSGTSRYKVARISKVVVNLWKSLGGQLTTKEPGGAADDLRYRSVSAVMNTPTPLETGEKALVMDQGYTRTPRVCFIHDDLFPCSVLSMNSNITYSTPE